MSNVVRHVLVADADPAGVAHATAAFIPSPGESAVAAGEAHASDDGGPSVDFDALSRVDVESVATPAALFERIVGSAFDLVLLDPQLGDDDDGALALLHRVRTVAPDTVVVIWAVAPTIEFTVRAMRSGALDVLRKGTSAAEIRSVVDRAIQHGALAREVRRLRGEVERARGLGEVLGESPLMRGLLQMIDRVAASDATVLIVGESGTGKELLARTIHRIRAPMGRLSRSTVRRSRRA
jgi:DNA-binding NtrC family response regulator